MQPIIRSKKGGKGQVWNSASALLASQTNNPWKTAQTGAAAASTPEVADVSASEPSAASQSPETLLQQLKAFLTKEKRTLGPNSPLVEEVILTNPDQNEVTSLVEGILGPSLHVKNFLRDVMPMRAKYFAALQAVGGVSGSTPVKSASQASSAPTPAPTTGSGPTKPQTRPPAKTTPTKPAFELPPVFEPGPRRTPKKEKQSDDVAAAVAAFPDANPLLVKQESTDLLNPEGSSTKQAKDAAVAEAQKEVQMFPTLQVNKGDSSGFAITTIDKRAKKGQKQSSASTTGAMKPQPVTARNISACNCEGTVHPLFNNCTACGRIICAQDGPGPCAFCGSIVTSEFTSTNPEFREQMKAEMDVALEIARQRKRRIEQEAVQYDSKYDDEEETPESADPEMSGETKSAQKVYAVEELILQARPDEEDERTRQGREAALQHRNTLLKRAADKARTGIIDEQADFYEFETSRWTSEAEKEEQRAKAEALEALLEKKRRETMIEIDPKAGKVTTKRSEFADIESVSMLSAKQLQALLREHEAEEMKKKVLERNNYIRSLDGQTDLPTHVKSPSAPLKCSPISAYYENSALGGRARAIYEGLRQSVQLGVMTGVSLQNLFDQQPQSKQSGKSTNTIPKVGSTQHSKAGSFKETKPEVQSSKSALGKKVTRVQHDTDSYDMFSTGTAFEASQALDAGDGGNMYGDERRPRARRPKSYSEFDNADDGAEEELEEGMEGEEHAE